MRRNCPWREEAEGKIVLAFIPRETLLRGNGAIKTKYFSSLSSFFAPEEEEERRGEGLSPQNNGRRKERWWWWLVENESSLCCSTLLTPLSMKSAKTDNDSKSQRRNVQGIRFRVLISPLVWHSCPCHAWPTGTRQSRRIWPPWRDGGRRGWSQQPGGPDPWRHFRLRTSPPALPRPSSQWGGGWTRKSTWKGRDFKTISLVIWDLSVTAAQLYVLHSNTFTYVTLRS